MEITVKGQTVTNRPRPQVPVRARLLAAAAAMLGLSTAATGAERVMRNLNVATDATIPTPDAPRIPFRGRGHRHKTPHRGTSRRANRAAKRRKLRARAR